MSLEAPGNLTHLVAVRRAEPGWKVVYQFIGSVRQNVALERRQGQGAVQISVNFVLTGLPADAEVLHPKLRNTQTGLAQRLPQPPPLLRFHRVKAHLLPLTLVASAARDNCLRDRPERLSVAAGHPKEAQH